MHFERFADSENIVVDIPDPCRSSRCAKLLKASVSLSQHIYCKMSTVLFRFKPKFAQPTVYSLEFCKELSKSMTLEVRHCVIRG